MHCIQTTFAWDFRERAFHGVYDRGQCLRAPTSHRGIRAQTGLAATEHETHLALLFVHVDATICHSWSPDVCCRMTLSPRGTLRACLKSSLDCDPPDHNMNHRNVKHCFPGVGMALIVLTQPAILPTPAERPCHDPSFGQDNAALPLVGTLDHHQAHRLRAAQQWHPRLQPPRQRAIGPEPAPAGQPMAPEAQPLLGSITLWHVGGGPHPSKEPSQGVHEAMALAPGALLGAVAPVSPTARGRGDGRRVDPPCAGLAVASCAHTEVATHDRVEPLPGAIVPPAPQGGSDQAPRRQSVGDKPPRRCVRQTGAR